VLEAGVNVKIVSEMLGQRDVTITMNLYQHVTPTMQKPAADAFDTLLAVNLAVNEG
jgi:integrase